MSEMATGGVIHSPEGEPWLPRDCWSGCLPPTREERESMGGDLLQRVNEAFPPAEFIEES